MSQISPSTSAASYLKLATDRVSRNMAIFGDRFPNYGDGTTYVLKENNNWVAGFWPGLVWLAYGQTKDEKLSRYGRTLLPSFAQRLENQVHINHDLGFLFTLSARAQYLLTEDESAAALALKAADRLLGRYRPTGKYIQAWGPVGEPRRGGQIIMDTMMNLPLLFWASQRTGDGRYKATALDHAHATADHNMRADGSTYHTFFFDQETGEPLRGETHQGWADESLWSRGQAWGICGFAMAAEWCPDEPFLIETARKIADRFMAELPSDDVPLWDLRIPADAPQFRDSSAATIALCGLLRLSRIDPDYADAYNSYSQRLFEALIEHCWDNDPQAQGLIKHGAMHVPKGWSTDGYMIYGDFFMLESLTLLVDNHIDLWGSW